MAMRAADDDKFAFRSAEILAGDPARRESELSEEHRRIVEVTVDDTDGRTDRVPETSQALAFGVVEAIEDSLDRVSGGRPAMQRRTVDLKDELAAALLLSLVEIAQYPALPSRSAMNDDSESFISSIGDKREGSASLCREG